MIRINGLAFLSLNMLGEIKDRRSIKKYSSEEVSKEAFFRVLEACRWAPSAHNAQPWRFIVIRDSVLKLRFAENMADQWEKDMIRDMVPLEERESLIETTVRQFSGAPIVIIPCLTMEDMDEYPDERRKKVEYVMAVQSVGAAIENLLLAAHGAGLGACWFCAPLFCPETVRITLKIPEYVKPQALITLGYPSTKPDPPPRRPLKDIIYENCWGQSM